MRLSNRFGPAGLSILLLVLAVGWTPPAAARDAIEVAPSIDLRSEDWIPMPVEEMKRAAGDAAFDRLTDAGRLRIAPDATGGRLAVEIALVGPAQTVGVTMTLDAAGRPTLVANATLSVRGLDHAGLYRAFRHVGSEAAERLVAKLDLLAEIPAALTERPSLGNPERRARFEAAQAAKRSARYAEARAIFEAVVRTAPDGGDPLGAMAADELRYGLPSFEARQALNAFGGAGLRSGRSGRARLAPLDRAEHLFRQIQAENPGDAERRIEADRAIDEIGIIRSAFANALRAQSMSELGVAKRMLMQFVMMEGACPDLDRARSILEQDRATYTVSVEAHAGSSMGPDARVYRFDFADGGEPVRLDCDPGGVRLRR